MPVYGVNIPVIGPKTTKQCKKPSPYEKGFSFFD